MDPRGDDACWYFPDESLCQLKVQFVLVHLEKRLSHSTVALDLYWYGSFHDRQMNGCTLHDSAHAVKDFGKFVSIACRSFLFCTSDGTDVAVVT